MPNTDSVDSLDPIGNDIGLQIIHQPNVIGNKVDNPVRDNPNVNSQNDRVAFDRLMSYVSTKRELYDALTIKGEAFSEA